MVERIIFNVYGIVFLASARANADLYDTLLSTYTKFLIWECRHLTALAPRHIGFLRVFFLFINEVH